MGEKFALAYALTGGTFVFGHLVLIAPAFWRYSAKSGVLFETFHFGTRAMLVFTLWPLFVVVLGWVGFVRLVRFLRASVQ